MFVRLGLTNARRNLSRSLLSIISMAVAAMVLSGTLFLAAGYPATAYVAHRIFAGGDIMIFPKVLSLTAPRGDGGSDQAGTGGVAGANLTFISLPRDWVSELYAYYPEAYDYGVFSVETAPWFDLDAIMGRLAEIGYADDAYPYLILPALQSYFDAREGIQKAGLTVIRGRNSLRDSEPPSLREWIVAGRSLVEADDGLMRALIDTGRQGTVGYGEPGAFTSAAAGGFVLELPSLSMPADAGGMATFDYSQLRSYEFTVVGGYSLPGTPSAGGREVRYATPQVLIPDSTFFTLWHEATGGAPVAVPQVSIAVSSLASVETHVAKLQAALPDCTVISVPAAASAGAARGGLPEAWSRWRTSPSSQGVIAGQISLPVEVKWVTLGLTSVLAALVVAANSLILLTQRRREIGVLRALGATGADVVAMVLAEVVLVSTIGAALGYSIVRVAIVWAQASGGDAALLAIGRSAVLEGLLVVGICVGSAAVFGLAPALRSTTIATMEVLRQE